MHKMELQIKDETYSFKAGFNFMREVNALVQTPVEGLEKKEKIGMTYSFSKLLDGDVEVLADLMMIMNKNLSPVLKRGDLEEYIEDDQTNIDDLFAKVIDFLLNSNVSKKTMSQAKEIKDLEEKRKQQMMM